MKKSTRNYLRRNLGAVSKRERLSKEKRSLLMSKIRSKNTKFERDFISLLGGVTKNKFQTNVSSIQGKPDLVFLNGKICIFLDSDFWHGWYYPRWKHQLKNDFWRNKIENNRRRDKKVTQQLKRDGWKVIRIWEHEVKDLSKIHKKINLLGW